MRPIEHRMPPSATGNDAPVGGLRATYAHAAAHLRSSLPYHMPNVCLMPPGCTLYSHIGEFSRPTRPERQRRAAYARRLHQNSRLDHVHQPNTALLCATFHRRARRAASCEALLAPPARRSSGFGPLRPPCARYGAHGWRRGTPNLTSMSSTVRARCTRCAWHLEALERPARNVILLNADSGGPQ
jgi:hypothetical protein